MEAFQEQKQQKQRQQARVLRRRRRHLHFRRRNRRLPEEIVQHAGGEGGRRRRRRRFSVFHQPMHQRGKGAKIPFLHHEKMRHNANLLARLPLAFQKISCVLPARRVIICARSKCVLLCIFYVFLFILNIL